jgi:hypothetical protein
LLIWQSVGADVDNGLWAVFGARLGVYMTNCTDWNHIDVRDFEYLTNMFNTEYVGMSESDILDKTRELGESIRLKLNMPVADLDNTQSRFFKEVWVNPPRVDTQLREQDTDWDIVNV